MGAINSLDVLVVEDDPIVSRLHKFGLETVLNTEVQLCGNGREALDALDNVAGEKDKVLILLDLNMPGMNGWEFLEACHQQPYKDNLVIVIVTSSSYQEDVQRALKYGRVISYQTKPLRRDEILKIVRHPEISSLVALKN